MPDIYDIPIEGVGDNQVKTRKPVRDIYDIQIEGIDREVAPEEYASRAIRAGVATNRSAAEQEQIFRDYGFNEASTKQLTDQFKLEQANRNLGRFSGGAQTALGGTINEFVEHGIPFRSFFTNPQKKEQEAMKRFSEGKADDKDIQTLAIARRRHEDDENLKRAGIGAEVIGALRAAPAIIGEFMAGGAVAKRAGLTGTGLASHAGRMAVVTPFVPSMYVESARQRNLENGREVNDWRGFGPAMLHSYSQLLVLGHVLRMPPTTTPGVRAAIGDVAKKGLIGGTEIAIADSATNFADNFIPKAYKISHGYGTFENLLSGNVSEAGRKFAVDTLTMAAFAGMHSLADGLAAPEKIATQVTETFGKDLALLKRNGYTEEAAMRRMNAQIDLFKEQFRDDPLAAEKLRNYAKYRQEGFEPRDAYRKAFGPPAQVQGGNLAIERGSPRQITQPNIPPGEPPGPRQLPPGRGPLPTEAPGLRQLRSFLSEGEVAPEVTETPQRASESVPEPSEVTKRTRITDIRLGNGIELQKGQVGLNPSEAFALEKYGNGHRVSILDKSGNEVGTATLHESGDTLHVSWMGESGKGGGQGRGKNQPFGSGEIINVAKQLADAFPEFTALSYTPASGRIGAGKTRTIDLAKLRGRVNKPSESTDEPSASKDQPGQIAKLEGARGEVLSKLTIPEGAPEPLRTAIEIARRSVESMDAADSLKDVSERLISAWLHHSRKGNPEVAAYFESALKQLGYDPVGKVGELVKFNGRIHEAEFAVSDGAPVVISRPGWFELGEKGPSDGPKSKKTAQRALVVHPEDAPAQPSQIARLGADTTGMEPAEARAARSEAAQAELARIFDKAGLTPPERWTLAQYAAGRTMDAIGKEAGVTREAIRQRLQKAKAKIEKSEGTASEGSLFSKMFEGLEAERVSMAKSGVKGVDVTGEPIEPTKKQPGVTSDAGRVEEINREIEQLTNQWMNAKSDAARKKIAEQIEVKNEARRSIESKGRTFLRRLLEEEGGWYKVPTWDAVKDFLWKAGDWIKWATSSGKTPPPNVILDATNVLPRLQNNTEFKRVVSDPQGVGRIPFLRWLFDPVRSEATPEADVFVANQAAKETGKDIAALWAIQEKVADKLFATEADGSYTRGNGTKGRMSDDIEAEMRNPGSTQMSADQARWVKDVWTPLLRDAQAMMKSEGIEMFLNEDGTSVKVDDVAYFPRPAIGKVDVAGAAATAGPARGPRLYTSEAEGVAAKHANGTPKEQIIYDPSAKSRVAKFISGLYSQIANHRTANDPALQGKNQRERFNEALIANGAMLAKLTGKARADAERELWERAGHPVWGREAFVQSSQAFAGKIYPKEVADKIEAQFSQEQSKLIQNVEKVSAAAKGVMLGGDLSFGFIQLLPTMFRKPLVWAKAMKESVLSLFDRTRMSAYLELPENATAARELTQLGSSFGRLQDFMRGLSEGEFATKIPGLGKLYSATGRAFGVAMDVAKIELWKAWKPKNPAEYRAVAEVIDSMLLSGRMEGIGLSPRRVLGERLMALAPSYYRGGLQLIGTAFQRGEAGFRARQGLAAVSSGILLATVAAMKAAGLDDDEIESRLDPTRGKFLKVPVELETGRTIEMGTSNILTSYVRLLGAGYDHFTNDNPIDTGADGNPILRWLRGKAAFSPRLAIDLWTGKDYFGERIQPSEAIVQSFEPLVVQQILHGQGGVFENPTPQTPKIENVADAVVSVFGFSSYPGSQADARKDVMNQEAVKKYGRNYNQLSIPEQAQVVKLAASNPAMPKKGEATASQIERAMTRQAERQARINNMVSRDSRMKLSELGKSLPPYLATLSISGTEVPLGDARLERYEELLAEEYDRTISGWNLAALKKMPADVREDRLKTWLTQAKDRAQNRLIRESRGK